MIRGESGSQLLASCEHMFEGSDAPIHKALDLRLSSLV